MSAERLEAFGLEYRFIGRHLAGSIDYQTMVAQLEQAIVQYARRQSTWFRKYGNVHWVRTLSQAEGLVTPGL